ncbi:MAG: hypothetical protein QOH43_4987 [Solirubrobacteraceae bacterium]|nr:hypothetical protein [Solirubrobacteraceae bacterium]
MSRPPAWVVAAALAALYLLVDPPSADLAAQTYRVDLFRDHGPALWDNGWYSGHHLPAYSILFPPLGALLGQRVVGALSAVAAAWCFERLLHGRFPERRARVASLWFAAATVTTLISGRLTFALGLALALAAAWALAEGRPRVAALLGALSGLGSPVAAAFLVLGLAAWWWVARDRSAWWVAVASLVPFGLVSLAFPEGGTFPFTPAAFWPSLVASLLVLAAARGAHPVLRAGIVVYVALLVASFALPTPMGGNAVRLGALVAGPVAVLVATGPRRRWLLLLVPALVYWQWTTPVDDWRRAAVDPSVRAAYYRGLLAVLERQPGPFRVEIPFTDNHWESARVAPHVPLTRGWERQLDRKVNALFYDGRPLTPSRYHAWLRDHGVRFVALPDAPLDYSAAAEADLVRAGQPFLREVWRDAHWRLLRVTDDPGLADGGTVADLGVDHFTVAGRPGRAVRVRVRWTPYWALVAGRGCVARGPRDTTMVTLRAGTTARVQTRFAVGRLWGHGPRCR